MRELSFVTQEVPILYYPLLKFSLAPFSPFLQNYNAWTNLWYPFHYAWCHFVTFSDFSCSNMHILYLEGSFPSFLLTIEFYVWWPLTALAHCTWGFKGRWRFIEDTVSDFKVSFFCDRKTLVGKTILNNLGVITNSNSLSRVFTSIF